jgi:hypothetical protein
MELQQWMHGTVVTASGFCTGFIQEIAGEFLLILGDGPAGEFWVCQEDFTPDAVHLNQREVQSLNS